MMQNITNHDTNSGLIVGGVSLSLLAMATFAVKRVLSVLKRRSCVMIYREYNSAPLVCGAPSSSAAALARAGASNNGDRDTRPQEALRKALLKADRQGKAMNAYIAENTFPEEPVAEDEVSYPISVLV